MTHPFRAAIFVALAACCSVAQAQTITTLAGNGAQSSTGDGGPASAATLGLPIGVDVDASGNRYIVELGTPRIRKITPAGLISTVVGTGNPGDDGDGGPATAASFAAAYDVALDPSGNLYFADYGAHRIRRVSTAGIVTTVAGNGTSGYSGDGGPAAASLISYPVGIATDRLGAVYFTEFQNCRIRRIGTNGIISTVAGSTCGESGDNGPAIAAQLQSPVALTIDSVGNVYVSEYVNGNRVRRIGTDGIIHTVAGTGAYGSTGDGGAATAATLNAPWGVALDAGNNLYISELQSARVRRVDASGVISTFAGTGVQGYNGDDQPATSAQLTTPAGLAVGDGGLLIADYIGARLRSVSLFTTCAAEGFSGTKLTLCRQVCEGTATGTKLAGLIKLYTAAFRQSPPCAR